ncbi:MAG: hypothetical protein Q7T38_12100 [Gallionella sp.]|nr:hypothetical protein [Gallionella sp.]
MFKIKSISVFFLAIGLSMHGFASTFFFPGTKPAYTAGEAPKWLHEGHGRDGYVTITSEVIPTSSCVPLSNHTFWGGEKTQLVLSMTTNGFKNNLDNGEIPIAAFDGRDNGSECASLSTLPINVVPLALLGSFSSFNPGELSLVLNVKSSSDSNQDFIGSAKLLLGAAAMVVSGGTATAIGGIAATVGNPVLSEAQTRTNTLMQGMVNGKTQIALTWPKLRNGVRTIEIPVYRAESSLGSTPDKKILQLQADNKTEKTVLFNVRLSFNYTNSLFDPAASGTADLPNPDSISTAHVLNYQLMNSHHNFLQILNDSSPSLLQIMAVAEGRDLSNACSIVLDKLTKLGLSNIDTAIVMKSFIDESKGGAGWYSNPVMVKNCFAQVPGVQTFLEKIYGTSGPKFVIGDVQDGIGKPYRDWRDLIGPALSNFRKALLAKENREKVLIDSNGKRDINVSFSPEIQAWPAPSDTDPSKKDQYPGLAKLANNEIKTIGCFIYKDSDNLSINNPGAYFILEGSNENFWLGGVKLSPESAGRISSLNVSELTSDWRKHFESYSYPGGDCAGILSRFKGKSLVSLGVSVSGSIDKPKL